MDYEEKLIKEYNQLKHREELNSGQHKNPSSKKVFLSPQILLTLNSFSSWVSVAIALFKRFKSVGSSGITERQIGRAHV